MSVTSFADYFSELAPAYARARPRYPRELFVELAGLAPTNTVCWDCATGSGQAATALAEHFARVAATDASAEQLKHATPHPRVVYRQAPAEQSGEPDGSVDLVTVATALHWFAHEGFYREVRRVLRPGGILAAWSYGPRIHIHDRIDALMRDFVDQELGPYWPPEFRHLRTEYRELPFPLSEVQMGVFTVSVPWNLEDLIANIDTWSGVAVYRKQRRADPVGPFSRVVAEAWRDAFGDPIERQRVRWPLSLRVGRV